MCDERDGKFHFKVNILSRLPNPVGLSNKWVVTNFKYWEPNFYALFVLWVWRRSFWISSRSYRGQCNLKKQYPVLLSCMFWSISIVIACYFNSHTHFSLLVPKLQQIVSNLRLFSHLTKNYRLWFLLMWYWIIWDIKVNHDENSQINYLINKINMIHWLTYIHFQLYFISQTLLVVSNIVLQFFISRFLKAILLLRFLSLMNIFTTV